MRKEVKEVGESLEKLDKRVPFYCFKEITETLHDMIMDEREFNRLVHYERVHWDQLKNKRVLGAFEMPPIPDLKEEKVRYLLRSNQGSESRRSK